MSHRTLELRRFFRSFCQDSFHRGADGFVFAVGAAEPAAGAADAVFEFADDSLYMVGTSFGLFRKSHPTNPFVAGQRSEALPGGESLIVG